jgi:thiol-disulfide isomerase/thioredoxin
MSANLYNVQSPTDYQEQLNKDLERVSVTNFWAPWAEPCKKMNETVEKLAKQYEKILFLQVCPSWALFPPQSSTYYV